MGTEKLHQYEGFLGQLHTIRDNFKNKWNTWKEENPGGLPGILKNKFELSHEKSSVVYEDYSHIYR